MIDPVLSLVFSFAHNKGSYALLLGSGISRPSGIPTGWEIVTDLIQKLASLNNEQIETTPEEWFVKKFKKTPNYSEMLNDIFKTPSERSNFLKQYFEPSETEIEQGLKIPTQAHNAIAKLVKDGYIKTIITTNFDRLLEVALEKESIVPNVISTIDSLKGSTPLIHSKCTIIKINGDYLDTRIRNTEQELEEYENEFNQLLDKILDEFGLITCGWSADWDIGLRKAFERCKSKRYTTYWIAKDKVTNLAQKIINIRSAEIINNKTADIFFTELLEKTLSIVELEKPHPISSKIAIATSKKYLSDSKYNINLHDLVLSETKKRMIEFTNNSFSAQGNYSEKEFLRRVALYESKIDILLNINIAIAYWGNIHHLSYLSKSLESIANINSAEGGYTNYLKLKKYPTLLLMYATGISALANGKYSHLKTLLVDTIVVNNQLHEPLVKNVFTHYVMEKRVAALLPGRTVENYTPFSDYLAAFLEPYFADYILDKNQYLNLFDKFEYLVAIIYADISEPSKLGRFWIPIGSFGWRNRRYSADNSISKILDNEMISLNSEHPLLKIGLFNNSLDRLKEIKKKVDNFISELYWG